MYSERIKDLRKAKGLSQTELGEYLGVSASAVYKWETGKSQPDINAIVNMSKLFGISTDFLLGNIENLTESIHEKTMREILDADPITAGINTLAANGAEKTAFTEDQKQELQKLVRDAILRYDKEQNSK